MVLPNQSMQSRKYIFKYLFQATARSAPDREREINNLVCMRQFIVEIVKLFILLQIFQCNLPLGLLCWISHITPKMLNNRKVVYHMNLHTICSIRSNFGSHLKDIKSCITDWASTFDRACSCDGLVYKIAACQLVNRNVED